MRQRLAAGDQRVPRSLLFGLLDEADAAPLHGAPHLVRLVADHDEHTLRRSQRKRRVNGVLDQRPATGLMQHLGAPRFHARAQAGGQDHDRYTSIHATIIQCGVQLPRHMPALAAFRGEFDRNGGNGVGIMPDQARFLHQVAADHVHPHGADRVEIVLHLARNAGARSGGEVWAGSRAC